MRRINKIITAAAIVLGIVLITNSGDFDKINVAADSTSQSVSVAGPYTDKNSGEIMYNYVYSGTYPQSEITGENLTNAIKNADYSEEGIAVVNGEKYKKQVKKYSTSDYATVGYYKYEPIKWRILENDGSNLILQADRALDCEAFDNGVDADISYSTSDLRNYLNTTFLNTAFTPDEQEGLLYVDENEDKVSILSKEEIEKYLPVNKSRELCGTDYSAAKGNYVYDLFGGSNTQWWTKSINNSQGIYISATGQTAEQEMSYTRNAIVPVIKLSISELYYSSEYKKVTAPEYDASKGIVKWQTISFGVYPQEDVTDSVPDIAAGNFDENGDTIVNGKKYHRIRVSGVYRYYEYSPIKWRVLEDYDGKMRLQSLSVIDSYTLSDSDSENGESLFEWLNTDFVKMAFNNEVNNVICEEQEKITLLNDNEIDYEKYGFLSPGQKKMDYTDFAKDRGVFCDENKGYASYWLKSSENDKDISGYKDTEGVSIFSLLNGDRGIVPVITIKKVPYFWNMSNEVSSYVIGKEDNTNPTSTPEPTNTPTPDTPDEDNTNSTPVINSERMKFETTKPQKPKINNRSAVKQEISWKKVRGAAYYIVYVKSSKTGRYSMLASTKKTSVSNNSLKKGHKYYYVIRACTTFDETECVTKLSDVAEKMTWNSQQPKINVSLKKMKNKSAVIVRWTKVSDAAYIQLYRAMQEKKFSKILDTKLNAKYKKGVVISYKYSTGKFKFKVRSYNNIRGKKVYSKYSSVHTVSLK